MSPGNLSPSGTITTTVPYLDITAPNNDSQPAGEVSVVATATAGCQPSARATTRFQIGAGTFAFRTSATIYGYVCPDAPVTFEVMRSLQRGIDSYYWLVDEVPQFNSGQYFHIPGPQPGQSSRVRVVVTNNCGGQYEFGMTVYGTTEIDGYSCQVNRQAPPTPKGAYPNPADASLIVEQAAGSTMTIFNSQGSTMYSGKNGKRAAVVDTRSWPAGPYYLVRRYEQGRATRQIIRVEH